MEDEDNQVTLSGFFKNGLLSGMGVIDDKKNKITKRGNFKEGKLFGLGEMKRKIMYRHDRISPGGERSHS